jgi:hypothetical protein
MEKELSVQTTPLIVQNVIRNKKACSFNLSQKEKPLTTPGGSKNQLTIEERNIDMMTPPDGTGFCFPEIVGAID